MTTVGGRRTAIRWAGLLTVSAVAACGAVLGGVGSPLRPVLVFWFLLVCPGLPFAMLLRVGSRLFEAVLAVSLSMLFAVVITQVLLFAGLWSMVAAVLLLAGLTVLGAGLLVASASLRPAVAARESG